MSSIFTHIAHVDCNNFFVSCEQLFRPDLVDRPVLVLSSNDGCIVSRSNEAKALGFKMGEPYFLVRERCKHEGVVVFSSNFDLYRDLSRRVMYTLRCFSDNVEVYSIDEAFLSLNPEMVEHFMYNAVDPSLTIGGGREGVRSGTSPTDNSVLHNYATLIYQTVLREVGIPVSVGIAPTKTLAKVATHLVKEANRNYDLSKHTSCDDSIRMYVFGGDYAGGGDTKVGGVAHTRRVAPKVGILLDARAQQYALSATAVEDVWGVGRRLAPKLRALGITNAAQLRDMSDAQVRACMSITGLRTVHELRGIPCLQPMTAKSIRKSLLHSRSFGVPVRDLSSLRAAVAYHARKVAEILRAEGVAAREISVSIRTSRHKTHGYYKGGDMMLLLTHTNDTLALVRVAIDMLDRVYRPGYAYTKAGVMVCDIIPEQAVPRSLFDTDTPSSDRLMHALDTLRHRFGDIVHTGNEVTQKQWFARHDLLSPRYTTAWECVPRVPTLSVGSNVV